MKPFLLLRVRVKKKKKLSEKWEKRIEKRKDK
jgi:hypothetical protein